MRLNATDNNKRPLRQKASDANVALTGGETWRLAAELARRQPWRAAGVVSLLLLSGLAEGIGLLPLLPLLDMVGARGSSSVAATLQNVLEPLDVSLTVGVLLLIVTAAIAVKGLLFVAAMRRAGYLGSDIATDLRIKLIDGLTNASWSYFVTQPIGILTNGLGLEAARAAQFTLQLSVVVARTLQVAVYLGVALLVSWQVTVGALLFGLLMFAVLRNLVTKARVAAARESTLIRSLSARLTDGLSAMKAMKAMNREDKLRAILTEEARQVGAAQKRQIWARAILPAVQEPVITAALAVGLYVALKANMLLSDLLFLAVIFHRIVTRMGAVQTHLQDAAVLQPSIRSVKGLVEATSKAHEPTNPGPRPSLTRAIRFEDVTFRYKEHTILDRVSFTIPAGSLVSISGPSGVGKTTLIDLLVGLLTPADGTIYVDDDPLHSVDIREWRRKVGYVSQDPVLLHESVRMNITLQDETISATAVEESLQMAGADDFVNNLPDGLDTIIGERGIRLSGGQRQRLAIARALVHQPQLLLLDEATTALDPRTEQVILQSLKQLKEQITIVAISHQRALQDVADKRFILETPTDLAIA